MDTDRITRYLSRATSLLHNRLDLKQRCEWLILLAYAKLYSLGRIGQDRWIPLRDTRDVASWFHESKPDFEEIEIFIKEADEACTLTEDRTFVQTLLSILPDDKDLLEDIVLKMPVSSRGTLPEGTPPSLAALAIRLLDRKENESLADFGTGTGSFLVEAAHGSHCESFYGNDIDTHAVGIAKLRMDLLKVDGMIEQIDMFTAKQRYDKVFSNYPFLKSNRTFREEKLRLLGIERATPPFQSSDWLFNWLLATSIAPQGKAVGIMTNGSGWNSGDEHIRRYFIEQGWIEAVISLPEKLFPYTNIAASLIVFSRENRSVRMVDASKVFEKGRRLNTFGPEDIDRIVQLCKQDGKASVAVSPERLAYADFNLIPSRYLEQDIIIPNGIELQRAALSITRGAGIGASELEKRHSLHPTAFRYLMLQNITEGKVDEDLPFLKDVEPPLLKYCARNGDLVVSKIGPNFKAAVVEANEQEQVLCTGNLYIIRIDTEQFDPRYVQIHFESERGQEQLNRICVGTAMRSISIKDLKQVLIPYRSLEEQRSLVEQHQALRKSIERHRQAINAIREEMKGLLEGEGSYPKLV